MNSFRVSVVGLVTAMILLSGLILAGSGLLLLGSSSSSGGDNSGGRDNSDVSSDSRQRQTELVVEEEKDKDNNDKINELEGVKIWGYVIYYDQYGGTRYVEGINVTLLDVHTGDTYSVVSGKNGYFKFDNKLGYFILEATPAEGFVATANSRTDIFAAYPTTADSKAIRFELELKKVTARFIDIEGYVKSDTTTNGVEEEPLANVLIEFECLDDEYFGYKLQTVTDSGETDINLTGHYKVTLFEGKWRIWCSKPEYQTIVLETTFNQSLTNYNFTLPRDGFRITGMVTDTEGEILENFDVYLWDWNYSRYLHTKGYMGIYEFYVYPSNFTPLFHAPGYHLKLPREPKTDQILVIEVNETIAGRTHEICIELEREYKEFINTTVSFIDNDWNRIELKSNWKLNSSSQLYGLKYAGMATPRLQIDYEFGTTTMVDSTADVVVATTTTTTYGNLTETEVESFRNWLIKRGPYHIYTANFIVINSTYYEITKIDTDDDSDDVINYTVEIDGFEGSIDSTQPLYINTTASYEAHDKLANDSKTYVVEIKRLRPNEQLYIRFPEGYEVNTELRAPNELVNYHTVIIREAPVSLELAIVTEPVANITVRVDDKTYYVTDRIIVKIDKNITFDAGNSYDPVGTIENYTWCLGGEVYRYDVKITYAYTKAGIKNVSLWLTDSSGKKASSWVIIRVDDTAPEPVFEIRNAEGEIITEVAQNEEFTVDASKSKDTIDGINLGAIPTDDGYIWDFGDDTPTIRGVNATHQYKEAGEYVITLTVRDSVGFESKTNKTIFVRDIKAPKPKFKFDPEKINVSEPITFNATETEDNYYKIENLTFKWNFSDDTPEVTGKVVTHIFNKPGVYTVSLNVSDPDGNFAYYNRSITVRGPDFTIIEDLSVSKRKPKAGEVIKIKAIINNTYAGGEVIPISNVTVALFVDSKLIATKIIAEIPTDSDTEVKFKWKTKAGKHTLRVVVDPYDNFAEWLEDNNEQTYTITVREKPIDWPLIAAIIAIIIVVVVFVTLRIRRVKKRGRRPKKKKVAVEKKLPTPPSKRRKKKSAAPPSPPTKKKKEARAEVDIRERRRRRREDRRKRRQRGGGGGPIKEKEKRKKKK